ncbi:hypothetical protein KBZ21_13235 [Streptomyces sp. A73]|nr:hypothetical protein [Streptomyces sp. A73]
MATHEQTEEKTQPKKNTTGTENNHGTSVPELDNNHGTSTPMVVENNHGTILPEVSEEEQDTAAKEQATAR